MKRINQILKDLNYPKFYEKDKNEDGSVDYVFDNYAVREYDYKDNKLFLDSLPTKEEDIHKDDVEFIIQYIQFYYTFPCGGKDADEYLMKLVDSHELGKESINSDGIVRFFAENNYNFYGDIMKIEDEGKNYSKEMNDVQEKLLSPLVGMLETIAEGLCKTLDVKNEVKPEKVSKKELKKLIKTAKGTLNSFKNSKSEFGESKKKIKKNLKGWKKELKKIKKSKR